VRFLSSDEGIVCDGERDSGAAAMRMEVVARVGGLRHLNGAAVGTGERRDAEIRYLRRVLDAQRRAAAEVRTRPPPQPDG